MRRSRRALAASVMLGMVGGSLAAMGPAQAAVYVSGSTIDSAGNYVDGVVYAVDATTGATVGSDYAESGAFDIPLENGAYKLEFYGGAEFESEYYRDKADFATADVITVAGAAQTLAPWTIDRAPSVTGVVRTTDGRGVYARVDAYDATTGSLVATDYAERSGAFRIAVDSPVKLLFSGSDPDTDDTLASEYFNDKATLASADAVTPTAAGADVGVVTLAPGGSISGRITSEAGAPLYRAQACAAGVCDDTDANGYYRLEGVNTGSYTVRFDDPIGEYVGEYWNNVPLSAPSASRTLVTVAPGQAVASVDAALAAAPVVAPNGVDVSGTVRDELGNLGIGYEIDLYDTPADPRDATQVGTTISNRAGQYSFTQLDRIGGETEFKIVVRGEGPREDGDFARRTTWSGNKLGYDTATVVPAAPARTLDFTLPVAGGVSGSVTSEAGGVPVNAYAYFRNSDGIDTSGAGVELDGTYDERTLWAGTYTVQFGGYDHVSEWWKDALPEDATPITVKPGQMTTGISAVLSKDVKTVERPEITGNAWVGKTVTIDAGRWNTQAGSTITYEWLAGTTVVATGPALKVTKAMLGKKLTGRVTNDAGFAQGQALTKTTPKVGYQPKVKAKVTGRSAAITLKVKPLKAKKVKATIKVFEVVGVKKNGDDKRKLLGKGKITKGTGVVRFKKALGKGKHELVFSVKGKGKVGSGDITKKVKLKR